MKVYSFEKLECWQQARLLSVWIFQVTKFFPQEEKLGVISQMRRAAISIASNIAGGTSRTTAKDQAHFSTIAYSSTIELLNDLIITKDLEFINNELYEQGRGNDRKTNALNFWLAKSPAKKKLSFFYKRFKPLNP